MRDEKKWRMAVAEFQAIRANVPGFVGESFVNDYHLVLDKMASASEEDLDSFRIPTTELKPRVVSFQMGSFQGGPGRRQYSKDNFCDSNLFQRRIDALSAYLPVVEETMRQPQVSDEAKDYWLMSTAQLERLAHRFNIEGYGDQHGYVDRDVIISALLKRDKAMQPAKPAVHNFTNQGTIIGSSVQQGSHESSAVVNFSGQEQRELLQRVWEAIPKLALTPEQTQAITTDLATVELQLNSGNPRKSILDECWSSVRNILEGAAGSVVATALLYELAQYLH
jgi:hypothetical protein